MALVYMLLHARFFVLELTRINVRVIWIAGGQPHSSSWRWRL